MSTAVATIAPLPAISAAQARFVDEYMIDNNATRAYKVAYPNTKNDNVAAANSSRLIRTAKVAAHITFRRGVQQDSTNQRAERVLKELERIGYVDLLEIWRESTESGQLQLKPISEWPEDCRRAIAGLKVKNYPERRNTDGVIISEEHDIIEIKFWGKTEALRLLGMREGMFLADDDGDSRRPPRPLQIFVIGGQTIAV